MNDSIMADMLRGDLWLVMFRQEGQESVEVLRLPAHSEPTTGFSLRSSGYNKYIIRVVPEIDQVFIPSIPGTHRLAVHNVDDVMLFVAHQWELPAGSTLSSMAVAVSAEAPA